MLTARYLGRSLRPVVKSRHPTQVEFTTSILVSLPKAQTHPQQFFSTCLPRGKTTTQRKLKDFPQGLSKSDPLPPVDEAEEEDLSLMQVVKNNIAKYPGCVVLTEVGNFYELYYEHAKQYGPLLNLKVATRGKDGIAMAGFVHSQLKRYLKALVHDLDQEVAICEEQPKYDSNGQLIYPIERRVTRIVSRGSVIEDELMDATENNFILAVRMEPESASDSSLLKTPRLLDAVDHQKVGLAWIDLPTGQFFLQTTTRALLPATMLHIDPREVILDRGLPKDFVAEIKASLGTESSKIVYQDCDPENVENVDWNTRLESPLTEGEISQFTPEEKHAAQWLMEYAKTRFLDSELKLWQPRKRGANQDMFLDRSSLRGLEIFKTARDGFGKGSLLNSVRRTVTQSGTRLLRHRLNYPSCILEEIEHRQDLVTCFVESPNLRDEVRFALPLYDVQRIVQKFTLGRGDADDLLCLSKAISATADIGSRIKKHAAKVGKSSLALNALLARLRLDGPMYLNTRIFESVDEQGLAEMHRRQEDREQRLASAASIGVADGEGELEQNVLSDKEKAKIAAEWKAALASFQEPWIMKTTATDTLRQLHSTLAELKNSIRPLQERLRKQLSTESLKLCWRPGLGYYCHVSKSRGVDEAAAKSMGVRDVASTKTTRSLWIRDWSDLGKELEQVKLQIRMEEQAAMNQLRQLVLDNMITLRRNAALIDEIDVAAAFALRAAEQGWTRPVISNSTVHKIVGGRHPTVTLGLEEQGMNFVSNDLNLGDKELAWLVTGPNMAGKSTFLRQNALITILAQTGSYVPADYAEIGIVDKIFSRIGAADDLFRNQSTFMVEMLETAEILKNATQQSFVIMDEVGRGTTPEDGTAVAFASLHHLYHVNRCRTLFATHFHEISDRTQDWPGLGHYCTDVHEDESGAFAFIHRLHKGTNKQSHALKVAKMARMPAAALEVATVIREELTAK